MKIEYIFSCSAGREIILYSLCSLVEMLACLVGGLELEGLRVGPHGQVPPGDQVLFVPLVPGGGRLQSSS